MENNSNIISATFTDDKDSISNDFTQDEQTDFFSLFDKNTDEKSDTDDDL